MRTARFVVDGASSEFNAYQNPNGAVQFSDVAISDFHDLTELASPAVYLVLRKLTLDQKGSQQARGLGLHVGSTRGPIGIVHAINGNAVL